MKISWNILVDAFGKNCIANTKYGQALSIRKIKKNCNFAECASKLGAKIDVEYYTGRGGRYTPITLTGYTKECLPIYSFKGLFEQHSYHFTT